MAHKINQMNEKIISQLNEGQMWCLHFYLILKPNFIQSLICSEPVLLLSIINVFLDTTYYKQFWNYKKYINQETKYLTFDYCDKSCMWLIYKNIWIDCVVIFLLCWLAVSWYRKFSRHLNIKRALVRRENRLTHVM